MTNHPIPFSAPMVRALLDGRKTQTRRMQNTRRPYSVGDRLWVKETWKPGAWRDDGRVAVDYRASPELVNTPWIHLPEMVDWDDLWRRWTDELRLAGSEPDADGIHHWEPGKSPLKWRSSRLMPRWASRITLTVTDVRLQRLIEISEADAWAEGCRKGDATDNGGYFPADEADPSGIGERGWDCARDWYADLWDNIHSPDAWDANPLVWAYTFTVARGNIDNPIIYKGSMP